MTKFDKWYQNQPEFGLSGRCGGMDYSLIKRAYAEGLSRALDIYYGCHEEEATFFIEEELNELTDGAQEITAS